MTELPVKSFYDIPGWFWWLDMTTFEALLDAQVGTEPSVVVEMGTYMGKSAVVIGKHLRDGDRFVALDLFGDTARLGDSPQDQANRRESEKSYKTLTRQQFEQNYLALHSELPEIVQGLSSEIVDHVEPGTARYVHIDASHMYAHVRVDARNAKAMLGPGGVVVFDDYRSEHTPGVAAAVWEAVFTDGLIPLALTPHKFYGVYDDIEPYHTALRDLYANDSRYRFEEQEIAGHRVLRATMGDHKKAATAPAPVIDIERLATSLAAKLAEKKPAPVPAPVVDVDRLATSLVDKVAPLLIEKLPKPPPPPPKPVKPRPKPAPTTLSGKLVRVVARNAAPPALTKWVLSLQRRTAGSVVKGAQPKTGLSPKD